MAKAQGKTHSLPGPRVGPGIAPAKPMPAPAGQWPRRGRGKKKMPGSWTHRGQGPNYKPGRWPYRAGSKISRLCAGPAGAGAETISPVASTSKLAKLWCIAHQKDLKSVVILVR